MVKMEPALYVEFCVNAQKFPSREFWVFCFFSKELLQTQCAEYRMDNRADRRAVGKGNPY